MQEETVSSQQRVHAIIDDGRVSGQQLLVIALCFLFNMLDGFDITAMAVVAGAVGTEMAITPERLGWIFSFALAGMMGGAMFLAPVSDIIGRRKTIIVSILVLGVSVLLTATASSLTEFVVLRFLAGLGAGAMLASQATLADEYSPDRYRALSVAIVTSGYPAGAMMTSVAAAAIMPEFGWRGMFWFGGVLTLVMVVIALLLIPESLKYLLERRPANALQRINEILGRLGKAPLDELPAPPATGNTRGAGFVATLMKLGAREHRRTTLMLWSTFFLSFTALYFLLSWVPKLVEDAGFTAGDGRSAFFLMNLGAIIGIYTLGVFSTRLKLTSLIAVFFLLSAIGMVVYAAAPARLGLLLVIIFLVGLFQQGGFTAMYSAAAKSYPTDVRSTGIGWAIGLGRLGAVIGPAAAGYLIAGGLGIAANFVIFAIPMAVSAVLAYRLNIR